MPRCNSCGNTTSNSLNFDNGRFVTTMCDLCLSEVHFKEQKSGLIPIPKLTFWERFKGKLRRIFKKE